MRRNYWLMALLLPVAGCYYQPPATSYGYVPASPYESAPPAYAPGYTPYAVYPGYSYNDGSPVIIENGVQVPLIYFGGSWGYYDADRRWHRAPREVERDIERHREGGDRFRPDERRPEPMRPDGFHPDAPRPDAFRPDAFRREAAPPPRAPAAPQRPWDGAERPPAPRPPAYAPRPAPVGGPAPAARPPARQEDRRDEHRGDRRCPPGQRC